MIVLKKFLVSALRNIKTHALVPTSGGNHFFGSPFMPFGMGGCRYITTWTTLPGRIKLPWSLRVPKESLHLVDLSLPLTALLGLFSYGLHIPIKAGGTVLYLEDLRQEFLCG